MGKIDSDASFDYPFPYTNIPKRLVEQQKKLLCTHSDVYYDNAIISRGVRKCIDEYIVYENQYVDMLMVYYNQKD